MLSRVFLAFFVLTSATALAQDSDKAAIAKSKDNPAAFLKERKLALIVGIDNYPDESGLSPLRYAAKDATDLGATLKAQGYETDVLVNERVMGNVLLKHLEQMIARADDGSGTIIFAFSGHGGQMGDDQYLALMQSSANDLAATGISVKRIIKMLSDAKAPRKMMFLDACRNVTSPGAKDASAPVAAFERLQASRGLTLLNSTGPGTRSWEDAALGHGVFTNYLLEGLNGKAAGPDGLITFDRLTEYVTGMVRERRPGQVPYVGGGGDGVQAVGDFYIAGQPKKLGLRRALIIGNDTYPNHPLKSAVSDARTLSHALQNLGFEVTAVENVTNQQIASAVLSLREKLAEDDVALLYYSGAGGMQDGDPLMFGVDSNVHQEQLRGQVAISRSAVVANRQIDALPLTKVLDLLHVPRKGPTLFVLDMCLTSANGPTQQLAMQKLAKENTLFFFAAQPGSVALETSEGGLFSRSLVRALAQEGLSAQQLYTKVVMGVSKDASDLGALQFPSIVDLLNEPFYFSAARQ